MARASAIQTSFNGGELSPRMRGRPDTAVYGAGAESMLGWIPLLQGPATAAPGTRFIAPAKGPFRLIPFEYDVTQGYQIEASDHALRFYTNDVRIEPVAGTPLEVASPWSYAQLLALDYEPSADVLYMVHGDVPMQQLRRTAAEAFALAPLVLQNGPYEDENSDDSITVTAAISGSSAALAASADIFDPGDVGGLFRLTPKDFSDVKAWEAGIDGVVSGTTRTRSAGKVYVAASGGRTGTIPPQHSQGSAWDGSAGGNDINGKGPYGVLWAFLYGSDGYGTIGAVADARHATLAIAKPLATSLATVGSALWAFGAFSSRRGWANAVTIWNERLVLAKGNRLFGSVVGGYDDFSAVDSSGNAQRDLGFTERLSDPNAVRWLLADTRLIAGSSRKEHTTEQLKIQSDAASPPVLNSLVQSTIGSAATKPLLANGRTLFIQRAGRKLMETGYAVEQDRYVPRDLTAFAEHIAKPGFVELAWQQELEGLVWAVRGDGSLAAMTYSPNEQVRGWAPRMLGGGMLARTISINTDPAGERDELWIGVQRGDQWWVLLAAKIWEVGDDPAGAWFVDAGLSYSGPPVKMGTGAGHLAGATVQVLADGKPHPDIAIGADGAWAITYPASRVTLGFGFPAVLKTMAIEAGGEDGTSQGKVKRISEVTLRLLETQGIRVAVQDNDAVADEHRVPANLMNQAVPLFTGDVPIDTIGSYERFGNVSIERFQPTPATVLAIIPTVTTSPR